MDWQAQSKRWSQQSHVAWYVDTLVSCLPGRLPETSLWLPWCVLQAVSLQAVSRDKEDRGKAGSGVDLQQVCGCCCCLGLGWC